MANIDPVAYFQRRFGITLKHVSGTEYAGPCPWCGGEDRFHVWEKGNYWCRPGPGHCARLGWVDELAGETLSDHEKRLLALEAEQKRLKRKQREHERRLSKLEYLQQTRPDLKYHKNITAQHLEYWEGEGIYPHTVEQFHLGYCPSCPTYAASPSYTIPVYAYDKRLVNVRHRLVRPNGGKYRPEMAGLSTTLFNAGTLKEPQERVLILEGEKKAIVFEQHGFNAVGLMGKSFKWRRDWFKWFRGIQQITIALDPDAIENAWRLAGLFTDQGFDNVSVARFPVKPDDAITVYNARLADIEGILANARKV